MKRLQFFLKKRPLSEKLKKNYAFELHMLSVLKFLKTNNNLPLC